MNAVPTKDDLLLRSETAAGNADGVVRIDGALTIQTVATWKELLSAALASSPALRIDLSRVSEFDTIGLQLLWSAGQSANQQGKELSLANVSEPFEVAARTVGLEFPFLASASPVRP